MHRGTMASKTSHSLTKSDETAIPKSPFVFDFEEKHLPSWARSDAVNTDVETLEEESKVRAKGRWAEVVYTNSAR
jgi:hypothetical protein